MIDTGEARGSASEVKFVVSQAVGEQVRAWARQHLEADPHGTGPFGDEYRTTTLYFDTLDRDVFHRRGSNGRAKYRIRRYDDYDFAFVERKLRRPGLLIKRRTQVPLNTLGALRQTAGPWPGHWFARRVSARGLVPTCQLVYRRTARSIETSLGSARLTVDAGLAVAPASDVAFGALPPVPVLEGHAIVEIKFRGPTPGIFKRLVEEFNLAPQATSKYRLGIEAMTGVAITAVQEELEPAIGG